MHQKEVKRFFSLFEARTSNRIFILIIGGRGCGKSYESKRVEIDDFLTKGYQFILLRRYSTELDLTFDAYFNDISKQYPDHEFACEGGKIRTFYIDGKVAGYAISICQIKAIKSVSPDDIYNIVFDEFLPEDGQYIKRGGNPYFEVDQCFNLYQTIARRQGQAYKPGVRFYFLSNATDINNPYFKALNLAEQFARGSRKVKTGQIYAELLDSNDYGSIKEIRESQFGQLIAGTRYGRYALDNEFFNESKEFIKGKLPSGAKHLFNIRYMDVYYGVWADNSMGIFYFTDKHDPKCKHNYALTNIDHTINTALIEQAKTLPQIKTIKEAYNNGYMYFKDQNCKFILLTFLGIS